ncbi:MAG: RES family NAD+ phosphorylase [Akkermansiaceae bacterium]
MESTKKSYQRAYRLVSPKRESEALNGKGAALFGGRWNSEGTRLVYMSLHRSLSALETLVHLSTPGARKLRFILLTIRIPTESIHDFRNSVPDHWNEGPQGMRHTQKLGDDWVRRKHSLALLVPSAVIQEEANLIVNPLHKAAGTLKIEDSRNFYFDGRLH